MSPSSDDQITSNTSEPIIAEILSLLAEVSEKFEPENSETTQWMLEKTNNPAVGKILQDTTVVGLRVLDAIGQLEPVNGTTISKQSRIPKGSVSKIARRLIAQKLIKKEMRPGNKKEILFRTTPLGRELFETHRAFDQQMEKGFVQFIQRYSSDELQFIVRVLKDFRDASFLDVKSPTK